MEALSEQERYLSGNTPRDYELGAFATKLTILEESNNERETD